jgi:hypothetical protein
VPPQPHFDIAWIKPSLARDFVDEFVVFAVDEFGCFVKRCDLRFGFRFVPFSFGRPHFLLFLRYESDKKEFLL